MRLYHTQTTTFSILAVLLTTAHIVHANPLPADELKAVLLRAIYGHSEIASLELRGECASYCGLDNQFCCTQGQACVTTSNIAACTDQAAQTTTAAAVGGEYQLYTTTYVETDLQTITTTYSVALSPGAVGTPTVSVVYATSTSSCAQGQAYCGGSLCCATDQVCLYNGQCGAATTSAASNSAFIRPTSNTVQTVTSTAAATTTVPFQTPVSSSGSTVSASPSNKGLSGGAIAGIVIGVLLGLFLLFLLLACLCCKGILDGLMALLGCGRRRRTEETYIETHHSHHGSSGAPPRRNWYGRTVGPSRPEKKDGIGFLGVAGILGTLAVILGLKRRHDHKEEEKSRYSATTYSYTESDYTTSASSASSDDRRTRNTRGSVRGSRR